MEILYDRVFDENGVQIFGDVTGEVYNWCIKKENRDRKLTVKVAKTGETQSIEDYLYKVP